MTLDELLPGDRHLPVHPTLCHPLTGEPLRAVGRLASGRVIWPVMGGAETDDDPDDDDPDDDDPDDDDPDDKDKDKDGYKPPSEADFRKMQRRISRLNANNKRLTEAAKNAPTGKATEDAAAKAKEAADAEAKPKIVHAEAKGLLRAAGLVLPEDRDKAKKVMARALGLIDLAEVDVDDLEDTLQDQIDQLKDDFPGLFGEVKKAGKSRTRGDAAANDPGGSKKSGDDKLADALAAGKS